MRSVTAILGELPDTDARLRVLRWALARELPPPPPRSVTTDAAAVNGREKADDMIGDLAEFLAGDDVE